MAVGLSPKYIQGLPFDPLTSEEFLVVAVEAVKKLDWNVSNISENEFIAYTDMSLTSWREEVEVSINGQHVNLKSECTGSQLFDCKDNDLQLEIAVNKLGGEKQ